MISPDSSSGSQNHRTPIDSCWWESTNLLCDAILFFPFFILTWGCVYQFRDKMRGTSMWERNIKQLPPILSPAWDQTFNILVYETTLQPTEPPSQGSVMLFLSGNSCSRVLEAKITTVWPSSLDWELSHSLFSKVLILIICLVINTKLRDQA